MVVQVRLDGRPVNGAVVVLESDGRRTVQGRSRPYDLAYGVRTEEGEVPLRGAHVGDELYASLEDAGDGEAAEGRTTITSCSDSPVIELERRPAQPRIEVEPREPGRLQITATVRADARAVPRVRAEVEGLGHELRVPLGNGDREDAGARRSSGEMAGLPLGGRASLQPATGDDRGNASRGTHITYLGTFVDDRMVLHSADGRVELHVAEGTLEPPTQLLIQAVHAALPDEQVASGPYRLTQWPDQKLRRPAVLTFELPPTEAAAVHDRIESLVIRRWENDGWQTVPGRVDTGRPAVTAQVRQLGTYALTLR